MPDENAVPQQPSEPAAAASNPTAEPNQTSVEPELQTKFDIGEEFGTAKKNLPPTKIILIGVAIILVVMGILAIVHRPKSAAVGSIDAVVSAEIPGQNSVMVAINLSIENQGEGPFRIHNIKVELEGKDQTYNDDPASAVDMERYFQALPELKRRALDPIPEETVIAPGGTVHGTVLVSFPVPPDGFAQRKSLKVEVWPYRSTVPLELKQ
jgi:hypothetical protein